MFIIMRFHIAKLSILSEVLKKYFAVVYEWDEWDEWDECDEFMS